jgi:glycosyltransferase involved in cell wall biosynthesis
MEYFNVSGLVGSTVNKYKKSKKILHIITGLNNGGAEAVLYRLCKNDSENQHAVISLMDLGKYGPLLLDSGIDVYTLKMPQGKVIFSGLRNLYRLIKEQKPDVVQTWMYHADLIGGVIARLAGIKNVFWNIRQTSLENGLTSRATIYVAKICALLSYFIPKKIICCANKASEYHIGIGYKNNKMVVIGNGYELDSLTENPELGSAIRDELLLKKDDLVLGMVGRYDPAKDHHNLLLALSFLKCKNIEFKCLLVGMMLSVENIELLEAIKRFGLLDSVILLEQRTDIPAVMNSLDIHILSSYSEAFPNVLAEAMACGTPCVSTDVGDAGLIIGETGWVVPPRDAEALAAAVESAANERNNPIEWPTRKELARQRIVENFSIEKMIESYKAAWSV